MNITFYNGASGLSAYQGAMELIANNIANVNTNGFKPTRAAFETLLSTKMYTNEVQPMRGHGVRLKSADLLMGQSAMQQTGMQLDFMIIGDGFFAVEIPKNNYGNETAVGGEIPDDNYGNEAAGEGTQMERVYTRNGAFDIGLELDESGTNVVGYLVDSQGRYVLTSEGQRIQLEKKDDGTFDLSGLTDKIGVFAFENPYGLQQVESTSFRETAVSGQALPVWRSGLIRQQALERSGANLSDEMTNMIVTQRAYQLSARMVQTADEMEEIVNNLR